MQLGFLTMHYRSVGLLLLGGWIAIWPVSAYADYLSQARDALKKGEVRTAQIDLRNAVRADPQNGEAHYLLGRVSFELGDPVAAEHEAEQAAARGFDPQQTMRLLGESLLAQNNYAALLDRMKPTGKDPNLDAMILVFRGYADIGLKRPDDADKAFSDAEKRAPNAVAPLLAEARLMVARGDLTGAQAKIDHAIAVQPKSAEALLAKAQLLRAKGDLNGALIVLDNLISDQPSILQARLDRASLEIALNKSDAAKKDLGVVLKATPGNVQAIYLQAVMATQAKDFKQADSDLQHISPYIGRIPRGYLLLALVKEQLGQIDIAEDAATRYLARAPNDLAAYKVLARIEFLKRRPDQVITTLTRITEAGKGDAVTYDMLGRAYAMTGQADDAVQAFQKAQALAPNDVGVQTRLATVRMGMGEPGVAMGDLEHTLQLAPKLPQVGEALFFAALATGDLQKAADALSKVKAAEGDTPVVQNLGGLLQLARLDMPDALKTFKSITDAHPDFLPARINLARVLAMQGDTAGAEKALADILDKHPAAEPALNMLSSDYAQTNRLPEAIVLLQKASAAQPDNLQILATLGDLYIRSGDAQKALDLAGQVKGTAATSPQVLNLEGTAQIALGHKSQAIEVYTQLLKEDPTQLLARRHLVSLLVDAGDYQDARNVIKAGMVATPRNYQLFLDYALIDLKATGIDAALATADNLMSQDRTFTAALALKGDLYLAADRPDAAIKAYQDALDVSPSTMLLTRLVNAQLRAGRADAARTVLTKWLTQHPKDTVALEQISELDIAQGKLEDAATHLQAILAEKPHNPVALNNLAWIYQQQHNPQALDLARQAYVLAPGPQTADTLGWILTTSGKPVTGVMLLRQANAQAGNDPRVEYHYAVALNDTGDKAAAIKLLRAVVAVKANFLEKAGAQQLLDTLTKGS